MAFADWLKLSRIEHAFMVVVAVVAAESVAAKSAGIAFNVFSFPAIFPALGPFFITAASFVMNDWFGLETDRANRRSDRPIVSGKISSSDALKTATFLYAFGLLLTFFVGFTAFVIGLLYAALSLAYDPVLKKLPFAGNIFIASSMSISFFYGNLAVVPVIQEYVLLFIVISFLAGIGRELLITLRDVKGDRKIGATTLPMLIGQRATVAISVAFFAAAVVLTWVPLFRSLNYLYLLLVLLNNALVLYVMLFVSCSQAPAVLKKARDLTLFALVLGILAFASLAL